MCFGQDIIFGNINIMGDEDGGRIFEIFEKYGIDLKVVVDIIFGCFEKFYFGQMFYGGVDVDQFDYLVRDVYYIGVVYGIIDLERFFKVMKIYDGQFVVDEKGIEVVEGMMVVRVFMYLRVYFYYMVKIVEGMFMRVFEFVFDEGYLWDFWWMIDCRVLVEFEDFEGFFCGVYKMCFLQKVL